MYRTAAHKKLESNFLDVPIGRALSNIGQKVFFLCRVAALFHGVVINFPRKKRKDQGDILKNLTHLGPVEGPQHFASSSCKYISVVLSPRPMKLNPSPATPIGLKTGNEQNQPEKNNLIRGSLLKESFGL